MDTKILGIDILIKDVCDNNKKTKRMIKKLFLFIALISIIRAKAQPIIGNAVPNIDWISNYGNAANPSLTAVSNALDASNNVYVTGYVNNGTNKDLVVLKYDSLGTLQWSYTYNNGSDDIGNAVAFDASGNVYCTGVSTGTGTLGKDYITVKLNSAGTQQWAKRYNNSSGDDEAVDLKIDPSGNVFVTGSSYTSSTKKKDIVTLKYTSTGSQSWATKWDGASLDDFGVGLVLSSNSNSVFVTGTKGVTSGITDIVTFQLLASTGATVWVKTHNGTASSSDVSYGIILSGANVVVCGLANNTTSGNDYVCLKYSATGGTIFTKTYDYANGSNYATDLVRDSIGNIAVTGKALNGSIYEYHTVKYDSTGTQLWVNKESTGINVPSVSNPKIACDTIAHHFYVSGDILKYTNDICVYQISPGGNTNWKKSIDGSGYGLDAGYNLSVNGIGVVYLSGVTTNSLSAFNITTIKISQTPYYYPVDDLNESPCDIYAYRVNKGQLLNTSGTSVTDIEYYTETGFPNYFFKGNQMSFIYAKYDTIMATEDTLHKVNVNFSGSNDLAQIYHGDALDYKKSYFLQAVPAGITDVSSYRRLFIPNIYPSIDLHYYSNADGIKYYFVVKPGANPNVIKHQFIGASTTTVTGGGNLQVSTSIGTLSLTHPYPYQVAYVGGTYSIVPIVGSATWTSAGTNIYSISTGTYNTSLPLVYEIDLGNTVISSTTSANLAWNTYVGGNQTDEFIDMDVDYFGNMYVLQNTTSGSFYTVPTFSINTPLYGVNGAQIYKFNKYGVPKAQMYYGASGSGVKSSALTLNGDSSVILVGHYAAWTPTNTPFLGVYTNSVGTSWILQLSPGLNGMGWGTRYPGSINDIDRNSNNDIYVLGTAAKTGLDQGFVYNKPNAINIGTISLTYTLLTNLTRFDQYGVPNWSSFLPARIGSPKIKIDRKRNNYYVHGEISGYDTLDFHHFNNYGTFKVDTCHSYIDGVIQKYSANDTLIVSTLYGGNGSDYLYDCEVLKNGDVTFVGSTQSTDTINVAKNPLDGSYYNFTAPAASYRVGWITKFDSVMHRKWAIGYGFANKKTDFYSVCTSTDNSIYIGGGTYGMPNVTLLGAFTQSLTNGNGAFFMFDSLNQLKWATSMGSSTISDDFISEVCYNKVNNNLCFAGRSGNGFANYPFMNFTTPQAYWQPFNNGPLIPDGVVGRFDLSTFFVGIKENEKGPIKQNYLVIYPNPTDNNLTINTDNNLSKPYLITLYNSLGQITYQETVREVNKPSHTINLTDLTKGIYFINITSEEINKTAKLIKE